VEELEKEREERKKAGEVVAKLQEEVA